MCICKNIQKLCKLQGLPVMKLEEDLGFARGSIYKWDTNTPSVSKVKAVADRLGTTVDALLTDDEDAE